MQDEGIRTQRDATRSRDAGAGSSALAKQLTEARQTASALQKTIVSLSDELESLRKTENTPQSTTALNAQQKSSGSDREE